MSFLLYFGPPFFFGWQGMGVIAPVLWWVALVMLAVFTEYRPAPDYNEPKSRAIAFGIALVAFVAIYYVARWLAAG